MPFRMSGFLVFGIFPVSANLLNFMVCRTPGMIPGIHDPTIILISPPESTTYLKSWLQHAGCWHAFIQPFLDTSGILAGKSLSPTYSVMCCTLHDTWCLWSQQRTVRQASLGQAWILRQGGLQRGGRGQAPMLGGGGGITPPTKLSH
jgi:hypothetical protein